MSNIHCEVRPSDFMNFVKLLYEADPKKYNNFDSVAHFVLSNPLIDSEKKVLAVFNSAIIFDQLNHLNPGTYGIGKAGDIVALKPFLNNQEAFLKEAYSLLGLSESEELTIASVNKAIANLGKTGSKVISHDLTRTNGIFSIIDAFLKNTSFQDDKSRANAVTEIFSKLRTKIKQLPNANHDVLLHDVDIFHQKYAPSNTYIPLHQIADAAGLNNALIRMKDGSVVEGIYDPSDKRYYIQSEDGTLVPVSEEDIQSAGEVLKSESGKKTGANGFEHVFTNDTIHSGLKVIARTGEDRQAEPVALLNKLAKVTNPKEELEMVMIPMSSVSTQRVARIQALAEKDPAKYSSLAKRKHETFESLEQQRYLSQNPDGKILTLARPQDGFILQVRFKNDPESETFNIWAPNNYAFVYGDNRTETVDFSNPEHVKEVQRLSVNRNNGNQALTDAELEKMAAAKRAYDLFEQSAAEMIQNGKSADVTDLFFDFFKMEKQASDPKTFRSIAEDPEGSKLIFKVPVVKIKNDEPDLTTLETKDVIIYFSKQDQTRFFNLNSTLASDEMVYLEGQAYGFDSYVTQYLKLDQNALRNLFASEKDFLKTTNILIRDNGDGTYGYRITSPKNFMEHVSHASQYMAALAALQGKAGGEVTRFETSEFTFKLHTPKVVKNGWLLLSMSTTVDGKLQIEFRGRKAIIPKGVLQGQNNRYFEMIDGPNADPEIKRLFNAQVSLEHANRFMQALSTSPLVKSIVAQYPVLGQYDMTKPDDIKKFFEFLETELLYGTPSKEMLELMDKSKVVIQEFTDSVVESVTKMFENIAEEQPAIHQMLMTDFAPSPAYKLQYLIADQVNGQWVLKVAPHKKNEKAKDWYFTDPLNFRVMKSSFGSKVSFTPKTEVPAKPAQVQSQFRLEAGAGIPVATPEMVAPAAPAPAPVVVAPQTPASSPVDDVFNGEDFTEDYSGDYVFELAGSETETESREAREEALEWLTKTYAEFGIEEGDVKELMGLMGMNARVLGAFRNKVIYLDKNLLGKGTVYHEAFHGVFRYMFTESDRTQARNYVKSRPENAHRFTPEAIQQFIGERNFLGTTEQAIDLIAEEILAEGFQKYMGSKRKPKNSFLSRLFEALAKMIRMFRKKGDYLDSMYDRVAKGQYTMQTIQSDIFENQAVFELIPARRVAVREDGRLVLKEDKIGVGEGIQVVNRMASIIINNTNSRLTFDQKFDLAVDKLLNEFYNLDKLIAQKPEMEAKIRERFGRHYDNVRFALGGRQKGLHIPDINMTGESRLDNVVFPSKSATADLTGENSQKVIKKMVAKAVSQLSRLYELQDDSAEEIENEPESIPDGQLSLFDMGVENGREPDGGELTEDEAGENFNESSMMEFNRMDSLNKDIRKLIASIEVPVVHADLGGLQTTRMIDPKELFGMLLKLSANRSPRNILPHLKDITALLERDGYVEESMNLHAFTEEVNKLLVPTAEGEATQNARLYHMIIDVLHGTEMDYVMGKLDSRESEDAGLSTSGFTISDRVILQDQRNKKRDMVAGFVRAHSRKSKGSPETRDAYNKALNELLAEANAIVNSKNTAPVISEIGVPKAIVLKKKADKLAALFEHIGLKMPVSLMEMSLLAIDSKENNLTFFPERDPELVSKLEMFGHFILDEQYLPKSFFSSLSSLITLAQKDNNNVIQNYLSDENKNADTTVKTFNGVLEKVSAYILTMNPSKLPSVLKNAEGKAIYRYTKYTPIQTMIRDMKELGLEGSMEKNPYFQDYLRDFILDNPMLGNRDAATNEFLKNMKMALFGGVQQTINSQYNEGKSFKDLDSKTLYLSYLLSFMSRDVHNFRETVTENGVAVKKDSQVQTFMRPFSQLEASQSNFLVTGRYKQMVNINGVIRDKDNNSEMALILRDVIRQEFNRMQRVYNSREEMAAEYNSGTGNRLILGFNATLSKDESGNTVANVAPYKLDKNSNPVYLRAYQFNKLQDLFGDVNNTQAKDLETRLREAAFAGKSFEDTFAELGADMMNVLNGYVDQSIEKHMKRIQDLGLLSKQEDLAFPEFLRTSSDFIPGTMRVGNNSAVAWTSLYGFKKIGEKKYEDGTVHPVTEPNYDSLITDAYLNHWMNGILFNDLFDGDMGMSVKNPVDYIKRNKKHLAAGSNMKEGYHKVSYVDTINVYVSEDRPDFGEFYSVEEIRNANWIQGTVTRKDKDGNLVTKPLKEVMVEEFEAGVGMQNVFDGQSVTSIMHQMDQYENLGRLDESVKDLLIAKHYRPLTAQELKLLKSFGIVMNSKKTVTSAMFNYHKLSEVHIDRNDVSVLVVPEGETVQDVHQRLHFMYREIYNKRKQEQAKRIAGETADAEALDLQIQELYRMAHNYFRPMPHRKRLHDLLNSMEAYNIDQMMDTEASKNATLLPIRLEETRGYHNMQLSSIQVENKFKYNQVETSGVKTKATFSVQSKALLPADIRLLGAMMKREGIDISEGSEGKKAVDQAMSLLGEYQDSLREAAQVAFDNFKMANKKDGTFDVKTVFTLIRESLDEQGNALNKIKLFDLDEAGNPVYDPNLPVIRHMLEYYFFSQYSKVTDEKGAGFKNIHISSFGYSVLEDPITGRIISTDEYRANPSMYPNARVRPLKVTTEADPVTQEKTYWVEVIMPKPQFENVKEELFWKRRLSKMFATRIPTEDKRSMMAFKVVDFIDSSNATGIIVPNMVHMLSGSDLDVDAVYGHMKAHYKDIMGGMHVFGDRSVVASKNQTLSQNEAAFREWVYSMMNSKDMKKRKREALSKIRQEFMQDPAGFQFSQNTFDFLKMYGFTDKDFGYMSSFQLMKQELEDPSVIEIFDEIKDLNEQLAETVQLMNEMYEALEPARAIREQIKGIREAITMSREQGLDPSGLIERRKALYQELEKYSTQTEEFQTVKLDFRTKVARRNELKSTETSFDDLSLYELNAQFKKLKRLNKAILKTESMMRALHVSGLPASASAFEVSGISPVTVEAAQNRNLDAKLALLTNETVYQRLYVNERSSVELFEKLAKAFGIEIDKIGTDLNIFTTDAVIAAKITTQMNKDGIGITANMNKMLALASQYGLKLKSDKVIWKYIDKHGVEKNFNEFGGLTEDNVRTINLIGNILGMFADGAKKPIPAALKMNEVNAGVTLNMVGLGMDPAMAFAFNFIPEIQKAVLSVQEEKSPIGNTISASVKQFSSAVIDQIDELIKANPSALDELISAGVVLPGSYSRKMRLKTNQLILGHQVQQMGHQAVFRTDLSLKEIGFDLAVQQDEETVIALTPEAQKLMLLSLYAEQVKQSNEVRKAGALMNLFKKLNPNFVSFDTIVKNIEAFRNESTTIFEQDGIDKIFADDQVWPVLTRVMYDLQQEAGKLFLERGEFFQNLTKMFTEIVTDSSIVAKTVTSFAALQLFKKKYVGSRIKPGMSNYHIEQIQREEEIFQEVMNPEFWYTNTLGEELEEMKNRYPDNLFLAMLSEKREDYRDPKTGVAYKTVPQIRYLEAKIRMDVDGNHVTADYEKLLFHPNDQERLFARKLFFHELVRTGLNHTPRSFMSFLTSEQLKPITDQMKLFVQAINLKDAETDINTAFGEILGTDDAHQKLVFFNDLYMQMARFTVMNPEKVRIRMPFDLSADPNKGQMKKLEATFRKEAVGTKLSAEEQKNMSPADLAKHQTEQYDKSRTIFNELLQHVFEKPFDKNFSIFKMFSQDAAGKPIYGQQLVGEDNKLRFDLRLSSADSKVKNFSNESIKRLAEHFGITQEATDDSNNQHFVFPLMIKVTNGYMLLVGTDENADNTYVGEALTNSVLNNRVFNNVGTRASYAFLPEIPVPKALSPLAFNSYDNSVFAAIPSKFTTSNAAPVIQGNTEVATPADEDFDEDSAAFSSLEMFPDDEVSETPAVEEAPVPAAPESQAKPEETKEEDDAEGPSNRSRFAGLLKKKVLPVEESTPQETSEEDGPITARDKKAMAGLLKKMGNKNTGITSLMTSSTQPLTIYTDGSHIKDTEEMGFGAAFEYMGRWFTLSGTETSEAYAELRQKFPTFKFSNNTMELMAILETVRKFEANGEHLELVTDSELAINWLWEFSEGSQNRKEKPYNIKEPYIAYLVGEIRTSISKIEANKGSVRLKWIKGHSGTNGNKIADEQAKNRANSEDFSLVAIRALQLIQKINAGETDADTLRALHKLSSQKLGFEEFSKIALSMIGSLRNVKPLGEIIDEIKCL